MEKLKKHKWLIIITLVSFLGIRSLTLRTHTFTPVENGIVAYHVEGSTISTSDRIIGRVHHIRNYKLFDIVLLISYEKLDSTIPIFTIHKYDEIELFSSSTNVTNEWLEDWR